MARVLLCLVILFMATGPIAHGYLAYKYNALQSLLPEEETHDEKPQGKEKFEIKDQYLHPVISYQPTLFENLLTTQIRQPLLLSEGYVGIPLMPPELV